MDAEPVVKRGRGRPRKNPLPTVVAKSTVVRKTLSGDGAGENSEILHSSFNFAGERYAPAVSAKIAPAVRETGAITEKKESTPRPVVVDPDVSGAVNPLGFKGPGVRLGKEIIVGSSKLSFFYIVFKNADHDELLYPDTMHSIQHLLSAACKEAEIHNVVKVLPCGSRLAMEVAVLDAQSDFSKRELRKLMITAAYMDGIPEEELRRCSNPKYQNVSDAHREICEFVHTMYGITVDSRNGDYSW